MSINNIYNLFLNHNKIITDTRQIIDNSIFFALKGASFNGNLFAKQALENGCSFAVIDEKEYKLNDKYILVNNVLSTLQELAIYHRKQLNIPIIGITGTNGKTTTKELIKATLLKKYNVIATEGNLNNHIGVPLTLLSMNKETEIGIVEMGANHIGEIHTLCNIANPDYGLITNIGKAHLEGFGSFEQVINTKSELYHYLSDNNKIAFMNIDNKILNSIPIKLNKTTYGTNNNADIQGKFIESNPYLKLSYNNNIIETQLVGKYNFENVLSAICIAKHFNVNDIDIKTAIEEYKPTNNRSQLFKSKYNTLLLDYYNANPSSMELAITNFAEMDADNKVIILGDMAELGNESENEHLKVVHLFEKYNFAKVILLGSKFKKASKNTNYLCFDNTDDFNAWISSNNILNSFILIKGSRSMQLENIVKYL